MSTTRYGCSRPSSLASGPREDHTENRQKGRIQQDNDRHGRTERINPIRKVQLGVPDAGVQCQPDHKCHNRHIGAERIVKAVVRHTQQTGKDGKGEKVSPFTRILPMV